jgi:hypothetical protein
VTTSFLAFDLEIARIVADFSQWRQHRPLGITCAATLDERDHLRLWYSRLPDGRPAPQMTEALARELLVYLSEQQASGRHVVTWNGATFDFDVLGEEAGNPDLAGRVARAHVDLMVAFACVQGRRLSLKKAALACGSFKGAGGIESGADAPVLWAAGKYEQTLAYLEQDVRATSDVTQYLLAHRGFNWETSKDTRATFQLPAAVKTLQDMTVERAIAWPEPDGYGHETMVNRSDFLAWA